MDDPRTYLLSEMRDRFARWDRAAESHVGDRSAEDDELHVHPVEGATLVANDAVAASEQARALCALQYGKGGHLAPS